MIIHIKRMPLKNSKVLKRLVLILNRPLRSQNKNLWIWGKWRINRYFIAIKRVTSRLLKISTDLGLFRFKKSICGGLKSWDSGITIRWIWPLVVHIMTLFPIKVVQINLNELRINCQRFQLLWKKTKVKVHCKNKNSNI